MQAALLMRVSCYLGRQVGPQQAKASPAEVTVTAQTIVLLVDDWMSGLHLVISKGDHRGIL